MNLDIHISVSTAYKIDTDIDELKDMSELYKYKGHSKSNILNNAGRLRNPFSDGEPGTPGRPVTPVVWTTPG